MQFKIHFDQEVNSGLYQDFCEYLFDSINDSIKETINPLKYRVREKYVIESKVIKWIKVPRSMNLVPYVENCLEMVKIKGENVIRLRTNLRIRNSRTKVSTLIRLLEYGSGRVRAYPVIRVILKRYSEIYKDLLINFIRERMLS